MSEKEYGFRIFIIGAGFSVPAGLPLASDLFAEIRSKIEAQSGTDTRFHRDIETYKKYRLKCDGVEVTEENINFEELMSYFDMEHFLGLRGGDTFSDQGNESQILIKQGADPDNSVLELLWKLCARAASVPTNKTV